MKKTKIKKDLFNRIKEIGSGSKIRGITLISLVITIVLLLILSGIIISQIQRNGIIQKSVQAKDEHIKKEATETINLKLTNIQIQCYTQTKELPSLQYIADMLCEDNEIEYVNLGKKKISAINEKIDVGESTSIFTKLEKYPYEFEIDKEYRLASIDGITVAADGEGGGVKKSNIVVYLDDEIIDEIPKKEDGYVFVSAECTEGATCQFDVNNWKLSMDNITTVDTICTLKFSSESIYDVVMAEIDNDTKLEGYFADEMVINKACVDVRLMTEILGNTKLKKLMYKNAAKWESAITSSEISKSIIDNYSGKRLVQVNGSANSNWVTRTLYDGNAFVLSYSHNGGRDEGTVYVTSFVNGNSTLSYSHSGSYGTDGTRVPIYKFASVVQSYRSACTIWANNYYAVIIPINE